MAFVLVVDDEKSICFTVEAALRNMGHHVQVANSAEVALSTMRQVEPDILLTDLRMDGMSGLDLLSEVRREFPLVSVVVMTAYATIDTAVSAIKNGAYDYLAKPFTLEQLEHLIQRIDEFRNLKEKNTKLREQLDVLAEPTEIVTKNFRMQRVLDTAHKVALADSTILITGESGTGKTLLAKLIHKKSKRNQGPFVVVNCATLSENLLERELFGYVKGAFVSALRDKIGRLQAADSGTVFLDEIGEISPGLQAKLLRFLQDRKFENVGDTKTFKVDVRIVVATNKDLEVEVKYGRFRIW